MQSYIIGSGWFLAKTDSEANWAVLGDQETRSAEMHVLWEKSIFTTTKPESVYIVDSDSPIPSPLRSSSKVFWLDLDKNYGHSTSHTGKYSGWMRAHFALSGMLLATDASWMIYVEQDALLAGHEVIESEILNSRHQMFFGTGYQSQPIQQSLYGVHRSRIFDFNNRIERIPFRDMELSPESKFAWAGSRVPVELLGVLWKVLRFLFAQVLPIPRGTEPKSLALLIVNKLAKSFRNFDYLTLYGGRDRPVPWESGSFYVTSCSRQELQKYRERLKNGSGVF